MQHFVDFYNANPDGTLRPAVGTDSHFNIDGRFGLDRSVQAAIDHAQRLRKASLSHFVAFSLYRTGNHRTGFEEPYHTQKLPI